MSDDDTNTTTAVDRDALVGFTARLLRLSYLVEDDRIAERFRGLAAEMKDAADTLTAADDTAAYRRGFEAAKERIAAAVRELDFPELWAYVQSDQADAPVETILGNIKRWVLEDIARSAPADANGAELAGQILDLHKPWYEFDGVRYDHCVMVGNDEVPEGHVCRVGEDTCQPDYEEHYVLACVECRQTTEDAAPGYPLWPCPTARLALAQKAIADG